MTMTTQTRVLPELDEALDFEPTCQAPKGCDNPAAWCGHLKCGCADKFACDSHVQRDMKCDGDLQVTCVRCSFTTARRDMVRWERIR